MKNYLSLDEFKKLDIAAEAFETSTYKEVESVYNDVVKFRPATIVFRISEYDDEKHFEMAYVQLENETCRIFVTYSPFSKKYNVFTWDDSNLENISRGTITNLMETLEKPVKMGKLSAKKLADWVEYVNTLYKQELSIDAENKAMKDAFLKTLEGEPVRWDKNGKSGEIIKNGLRYSFKIEDEYIHQNIEVYYQTANTLESFKALSDNKYITK